MLHFTEVNLKHFEYLELIERFHIGRMKVQDVDCVVVKEFRVRNLVCFDKTGNSVFVLWQN